MEVQEYLDKNGQSPYQYWFDTLDEQAARRVHIAMTRLQLGNVSNVKGVGQGVYECKIDYGPGYRVYLGKAGLALVILLGGGTKKRQNKDIAEAKGCWVDYKKRRTEA
ncbi:MAG: type II toxin-antitoxin system RelE/ParE family toxin [Nitrospirota bacterium]|nr:type II toxin-antitoxin system RelE/ParE family toxin [Nitrospirota bacterium]